MREATQTPHPLSRWLPVLGEGRGGSTMTSLVREERHPPSGQLRRPPTFGNADSRRKMKVGVPWLTLPLSSNRTACHRGSPERVAQRCAITL